MKRIIKSFFLICCSAVFFAGCASSKVESTSANEQNQAEVPENIEESEETQKDIPLPEYDDWKYKGFGTELPDWFEPAVNGDDLVIKSMLELQSDDIMVIISSRGKDVDQCEQILNDESQDLMQGLELVHSFWVRKNPALYQEDNLYLAVRIYILKDEVMSIED